MCGNVICLHHFLLTQPNAFILVVSSSSHSYQSIWVVHVVIVLIPSLKSSDFTNVFFFFFWLQRKKYDKAIIEWGAHLLTTRLHKNYNVSSHVLPQYVSPAVRTSTTQTYNYCNSFTYSNVCRHEMLKKTYFKLWTGDRKTENSRSLSKRKIKIEIHLVWMKEVQQISVVVFWISDSTRRSVSEVSHWGTCIVQMLRVGVTFFFPLYMIFLR